MTYLTSKVTSDVVENDTVESAVLNVPYIDPELFLLPF